MKIKTSELSGNDLDETVGGLLELTTFVSNGAVLIDTYGLKGKWAFRMINPLDDINRWQAFDPSTNWAQGGPIIERERLSVVIQVGGDNPIWHSSCPRYLRHGYGPTPLIAAMRCFVASCLGDEVDLPDNEFLEREV